MAQRAQIVRRGLAGLSTWLLIAGLAVALGYAAQRSAEEAIIVLAAVGLTLLVLQRDLRFLVVLAVACLAWGSSILPGAGSIAFLAKFGVLAAIVAAAAAAAVGSQRKHLPVPSGFAVASGALVVVALMSATWSIAAHDSVAKAISMILVWAAATIAIPMLASGRRDAENVLLSFGVTAAAVTVVGLVLALGGLIAGFRDYHRFNGLLNDANALGYWVAPILPAMVLMAAKMGPGTRRRLVVGSVVVLAAGIALSGSRGGAVAAACGVVVGFIAAGLAGERRAAVRAIALTVLAAIVVVLVFPALGVQVRSNQTATEGFFQIGTGSNREPAFAAAVRMADDAPLWGHGFATTPILFPEAQSVTQGQILGRTHNSYLEAAIDLGWPAAVWLLALGLSGLFAAWKVARRAGPWQVLGTVLLAGIVGGLVEGMFESGMLAAGGLFAFPFWTLVALAHSVRLAQKVDLPP